MGWMVLCHPGGTFAGGERAEQPWLGCRQFLPFPPGCCSFAMQKAFVFLTAWKLLVWEFLPLFRTRDPRRTVNYGLCSPHTLAKLNTGLGVLLHQFFPQPCSAALTPAALLSSSPGMCHHCLVHHQSIPNVQREIPQGCHGQPGKIHCLGCVWRDSGHCNPHSGAVWGHSGAHLMLHGHPDGPCPLGAAPLSHPAPQGALENHRFGRAVFLWLLLGWSPVGRVIPKLVLITSIGD